MGGLDEINICVAYELDGKEITEMPSSASAFSRCKTNLHYYASFPSHSLVEWLGIAKKANEEGLDTKDLPSAAQRYIEQIESLVGVPCTSAELAQTEMLLLDCAG